MIKFYGYKRCSTSKKARKWFDDHGIQYDYQDLVELPPTESQLLKWMTKYQDRGLKYFFNTHGQRYRADNFKEKVPTMTIKEAAKLMSEDGKLIKRPLVVDEDNLTCGFKEDVFAKTWLKK
ncbi:MULTISPECIES: arsenate reductase family protein [Lactobacillus]|uniref:Arsenate reductase family protein n=1 Tax=Lactobacillus xujianguonis TaxID=2495899 RepID=A0A437SXL8_9LACO|nr:MULTISPECIES: arsenate reductase family protein [Lactobacillus]RVU71672.1 arsenate reductase family protein [Lactobacillus xujianguonis]RVU77677.1 arsenate reductase family protein [Lactobacillus xujianguonis]